MFQTRKKMAFVNEKEEKKEETSMPCWNLLGDDSTQKEAGKKKNTLNNSMGVFKNSQPKDMPLPKKRASTTLQHLFNLESNKTGTTNSKDCYSPKLGKQLSENNEIMSLICHCSTVFFTFVDESESPSDQEMKRGKLLQLLSIMKSLKRQLPDQVICSLVSMIAANLFRPLPVSSNNNVIHLVPTEESEDLVSTLSPLWSHLQVVYDILLRLLLNVDAKSIRCFVDQQFVISLLVLFQSEDPRERESVKNVYHRIYSKFTFYRGFMRKSMNDVLLHYVFEAEKHCGIGELLEIWGSIINGFTVPLKEEHKLFLIRVLIPLHKPKGMVVYHRQLAYCITQFVQKEPMMGGLIVRGILKYWPITNCQKEILLISELEELVENMDPDHYRRLALPLCTQITRCLNSWNSQVAERAIYIWNNEVFVKMATSAMEEVFPVVVEGMEKNLKWHWSSNVKQLTENVKKMVEEMDQTLYDKCLQEIGHKEFVARQEEMKRKAKWERIELQADMNQKQNQHRHLHQFVQSPRPAEARLAYIVSH
ncbi:Serine/threonine protein phosphatase 2A 57 kDa regulatory subunit B' beta isoform [Linum perenne]